MIELLDKLNVRPEERRYVLAGIILVLVLIASLWVVMSAKNQYAILAKRHRETSEKTLMWQKVAANMSQYSEKVESLQGHAEALGSMEKASEMFQTVRRRGTESGLEIMGTQFDPRQKTEDEAFFDQLKMRIDFVSGNRELVLFLDKLTDEKSRIRVQDMDLQPDGRDRKRLKGNIKILANFSREAIDPKKGMPAGKKTGKTTTKKI